MSCINIIIVFFYFNKLFIYIDINLIILRIIITLYGIVGILKIGIL